MYADACTHRVSWQLLSGGKAFKWSQEIQCTEKGARSLENLYGLILSFYPIFNSQPLPLKSAEPLPLQKNGNLLIVQQPQVENLFAEIGPLKK